MGYLLGWELFKNIPFSLLFVYFFSSNFSMLSLGILLTTLSPNAQAGYTLAYSFVLVSFVFQGFLTDPTVLEFLYAERSNNHIMEWVRFIFEYYVGFNFVKIWSDLVYIGDFHFEIKRGTHVPGRKYEYKDFFEVRRTKLPDGYFSHLCAPYDTLKHMIFNTIWMLVLAWVLDNLQIPNHSFSIRTLLCMKKEKNFRKVEIAKEAERRRLRSRSRSGSSENLNNNESEDLVFKKDVDNDNIDKSVKTEFFSTVDEMVNWRKFRGLLVNGISKVYKKYKWMSSKSDIAAVKNIHFRVESGELLSILGQNGAGKTTLINVITGHLRQSKGTVKLFGLDLNKDSEEVKEILSLCPQFDIYWENLTVYEHLELFSSIRGMSDINRKVESLIKEVGLWDRKDYRSCELSGGMKRRLSIALSTLGNPKVIILDEPTTGLDPVTQKEIMELIEVRYFFNFFS